MKKNIVGIIGSGNMGEAIISGLKKISDFNVCFSEQDQSRAKVIAGRYRIKNLTVEQIAEKCDIIIICVKPQDIEALLCGLKNKVSGRQMVVSIAAGVTTDYLEKRLSPNVRVIRVMPNLPALVGAGVSAYCLGRAVRVLDEKAAVKIFSTMGKTLKVSEKKMNAVTAVSGSGPGFYAYLIDAFKTAGTRAGLSADEAEFLSLEAMNGTGRTLQIQGMPAQELVSRVCSKGGTTEAGLKEFEKNGVKKIIDKAVSAAIKRAEELNRK